MNNDAKFYILSLEIIFNARRARNKKKYTMKTGILDDVKYTGGRSAAGINLRNKPRRFRHRIVDKSSTCEIRSCENIIVRTNSSTLRVIVRTIDLVKIGDLRIECF